MFLTGPMQSQTRGPMEEGRPGCLEHSGKTGSGEWLEEHLERRRGWPGPMGEVWFVPRAEGLE